MSPSLKQALKRAIHLRPFGFVRGGAHLVPALRYHSLDPSGSAHSTSFEQWQGHLDYLEAQGIAVVTLSEALGRDPASGAFVAMSFDDGFCSMHERALPELARRGHRASFFVAADHLGGTACWLDGDLDALLAAGHEAVDEPIEAFLEAARPAHEFISRQVPELLARGDEACLREIHLLAAVRRLPTMDEAALRDLVAAGMEIGAHPASHGPLAGLEPAALEREITEARETLASVSGGDVRWFCHPYGPLVPETVPVLKAAGYAGAFGEGRGYVEPAVDRWFMPRIDMHRVFTRADLDLLLHPRNRALRRRAWGPPNSA